MRPPLTRAYYYGNPQRAATIPAGWLPPSVHPDECDHEPDPDGGLCSQCCPCDLCGLDRGETQEQARAGDGRA